MFEGATTSVTVEVGLSALVVDAPTTFDVVVVVVLVFDPVEAFPSALVFDGAAETDELMGVPSELRILTLRYSNDEARSIY